MAPIPTPGGVSAGFVRRFAARLRYPQLFFLLAALFLIDLVVPDVIPFADEILLGLATLLVGKLRNRDEGDEPQAERPPMKDVTPRD